MKPTALYRHFNADGALLYAGIAVDHLRRLKQHEYSAEWHTEITRIDLEWFSTREEALAAEKQAVKNERPLFNIRLQEENRRGRWAVGHAFSGKADGLYFSTVDVKAALREWQENFPAEKFEIFAVQEGMCIANSGRLDPFEFSWLEHKAAPSKWRDGVQAAEAEWDLC